MTTIATLAIKITADTKALTSGIATANKTVSGFARTAGADMARLGGQMLKFGAMAGGAAAVGVAALGAISVREAIKMESAFAGVIKTTDGLATEWGELTELGVEMKQGFRDLALEIPMAVEELMMIGELGGQLGIQQENLLSFTETIAAMGEATNLSTEEAAMSFARLANIMGTSQDDFEKMGSAVVALGNNYQTTESEVVMFAERIAGAGKLAGLTEADIFAIGTAMSSVGVAAEAGGTSVQKVLNAMTEAVATNSDELAVFAKVAGQSASEFAAAYEVDAGGAFADFVKGLGKAGPEAFGILDELGLKNERVIRAFLSLAGAGDLVTDTMEMSAIAWDENRALMAEAEARYRTTESQIQLLKNAFRDVAFTIGDALLPFINELVSAARPLIKTFAKKVGAAMEVLGPIIEKVGWVLSAIMDAGWGTHEMVEALTSLFGDQLLGVFHDGGDAMDILAEILDNFLPDSVMDMVWKFIDAFRWFRDTLIPLIKEHLPEIKAAIIGVGSALAIAAIGQKIMSIGKIITTFLGGPIGIVLGLIALFAAAWQGNWFGIRDTLTAVWENTLKPALTTLMDWLGKVLPPILEAVRNYFEQVVVPAIQLFADWLGPKIQAVMAALAKFWDKTLKPALSKLVDWLSENIPKAIDFLTKVWTTVLLPAIEWVMQFIDTVVLPILGGIAEVLVAVVGKAVEVLAELWTNLLQPALQAIWEIIKEKVIPIIEDKLGPILKWLNEKIIQPVSKGFGGIVDVVKKVVDWLGNLADKISGFDFKVPDWIKNLIPESTPPLVQGLEQAVDTMKEMHRVGFPDSGKFPSASISGRTGGVGGGGSVDYDRLAEIIGENAPVTVNAEATNEIDYYQLAYVVADILQRRRR